MRRIQPFCVLIFLIICTTPAFSGDRHLEVEVRGSREPYSVSVANGRIFHYAVRNERASTVSKFTVPDDNYVVVEVQFAGGYVLCHTVNLAMTPAKERRRVTLDRDHAIYAADLVQRSHTVAVAGLASETEQMDTVYRFERAMEEGNLPKAEKVLWDLIEREPHSMLAWNNLGALRLAQGNYAEAAEYLNKALQVEDSLFEVHLNLSRVYMQKRNEEAALRHARKANRIREGHPTALSQEAGILLVQKRYVEARPLLERLREADPYHTAFPDLSLAMVHQELGDSREAARCLLNWVHRHPTHPEAGSLKVKAEQALGIAPMDIARSKKR